MRKKNIAPDNLAEKYFNIADVMLAVLNADQTVNEINKKGCKILGYKEKDIIGKNWFDNFLPKRMRKEVKGVFSKLMAGNIEPVEYYENQILRKDGQERLIAFHNTIIKDSDGNITAVLFSGEDITERKKAEEDLHLHGELVEHMSEGVNLIRAADHAIVYSNSRFDDMMGYESEELVGENISILNAPGIRSPENITAKISAIVSRDGSWKGEIHNIRKDGTTFWSSASISSFEHQSHGQVFLSVQSDITERKRIEDEILSVSNIPAENPNPVIRISSDKKILYANGSFNKLLMDAGLSEDDVHKILPDNLDELIDIALEVGKPHIMLEAKALDRIISYNLIPIKELGYVNLYGRDITDRKVAEKELKKRVDDLEKFYDMAIGREVKMKELKKEIKKLKVSLSKYEDN